MTELIINGAEVFEPGVFYPNVFCDGTAIPNVSLSLRETLGRDLPLLTVELSNRNYLLSQGSWVVITRGGAAVFKGYVRRSEEDSDTKRTIMYARYIAEKALRRLTKRELYETEPALIVKSLNQPISAHLYSPNALESDLFQTDDLSDNFEQLSSVYTSKTSPWIWDAGQFIKGSTASKSYGLRSLHSGADTWTDYVVEADVKIVDNGLYAWCGVIARWQDWKHFYSLTLYKNPTIARLELRIHRDRYDLATQAPIWASVTANCNTSYNVKLKITGNRLQCYFDDVLKIDKTDSTYAAGRPGIIGQIGAAAGSINADNYQVVAAGGEGTPGWVVTANPSADKDALIDVDEETAWSTTDNQTTSHYFKIDMGEIKSNVGLIRMICQGDQYPENFKVEVSTNDADYTTIMTRSGNTLAEILVPFTRASVRYIKVSITANGTIPWKVFEVEIYQNEARIFTEGTINEYGGALQFRFDYTKVWEGIQSVAEKIGWDAYIDLDETLNFVSARGTDKSTTISFTRGDNGLKLRRTIDSTRELDRVWALGQGDWWTQLVAKSDIPSFPSDYSEGVFTFKEIVDAALLQKAADALLDDYKEPITSYEADVIDTYATGAWGLGDSVKITDAYLNVDAALRVVGTERSWSQNAESVTIMLGDIPVDLELKLRRLDSLLYVLNAAAQALGARSDA